MEVYMIKKILKEIFKNIKDQLGHKQFVPASVIARRPHRRPFHKGRK